jgi:uncharacterized phage protein gp47/JayE
VSSFGLTDTGFAAKPLDTIKEEIEQAIRARLGDTVNLLATSVLGNLVGILADREHEIWELLEDVYASQYPSGATGQSADNVASYTGVRRLAATKSSVTLSVSIDPGVTLPTGRVVSQGAGSDVRFVTTEAIRNRASSAALLHVAAEAEETGPVVAVAGTLTHIETPVTGWNAVTNALDADPGRHLETDTALLLRREQLLRADGAAALDAIVAAVLGVPGVATAQGFQNVTDIADSGGLPPHSVEILAVGGEEQDVVNAIFDAIAAGITPHGSQSGTATDLNGGKHTIGFTRPSEVNVWVVVNVTTDAEYPADGSDLIKAALVAHGNGLGLGADVVQSALYKQVFSVSGVVDVTRLWIGTSYPPSNEANIKIAARELSAWDTRQITVNAA